MYINHICSYVDQIYVHKSYMYVEINAINKKIFFWQNSRVSCDTSIFERLFKYINFRFLLKYKDKTHFILFLKHQRICVSCTLPRALNNIFQCDGVQSDDARAYQI